jgi:hypothetical protein
LGRTKVVLIKVWCKPKWLEHKGLVRTKIVRTKVWFEQKSLEQKFGSNQGHGADRRCSQILRDKGNSKDETAVGLKLIIKR